MKGESTTSVAKTAMVNEPDVDLESADKIFGKMQSLVMGAATGRSTHALPLGNGGELEDGADMGSFWQSFGSGGMPISAAPKPKPKPKANPRKRTGNGAEPDPVQKQPRVSAVVRMQPGLQSSGTAAAAVKDEGVAGDFQDGDEKWFNEFSENLKDCLSIKLKYEIPTDEAEISHCKSAISSAQKVLSGLLNQAWMFPEHLC